MTFKLGDTVEWTSQSGGYTTTKRGEIVEVVPARVTPKSRMRYFTAGRRREQSYIVNVPGKGRYWPTGKGMKLATPELDKRSDLERRTVAALEAAEMIAPSANSFPPSVKPAITVEMIRALLAEWKKVSPLAARASAPKTEGEA